ncbi:MAG: hypothetical protein WC211_05535 [Dehalococcoidia bacterium]
MRTETVLRGGILAVAWLAVLGTGAELALERHWQSLEQGIAWVALLLALGAVGFATVARRRVWLARLLAIAVLALSGIGVWRHINANYEAGELDADYAARWPAMTEPERWQAAALKSVGPAPILAAGVLAEVSLLVLLATIGRRSTRIVEAVLPFEPPSEPDEPSASRGAQAPEYR